MADTTEISTLLKGIQSKIIEVENNCYNNETLDFIKCKSLELLDILKLFLISERDSYYGYFLMNMVFEADFKTKFIAGIRLNSYPPIFAFNPLIFCKFDIKECLYIICHEIDHVLLDHPTEMVKANPTKDPETFTRFNLAADASVNDRLNHEIATTDHGDFMSQPDGLITSKVLSKMYNLRNVRSLENYAYYYELIKQKNKPSDSPQSSADSMVDKKNQQNQKDQQDSQKQQGQQGEQNQKSQSGQQDSQNQNGEQGDNNESSNGSDNQNSQNGKQGQQNQQGQQGKQNQQGSGNSQGEDSDNGNGSGSSAMPGNNASQKEPVATAKSAGELIDHEWDAGDDAEEAHAVVRELVNSVEKMMDEETRGKMPAHFTSLVEKINTPPSISWQQILKKYIGTIAADKRKTRMRLNRRQPLRFDLSGQMDDKVLKIVVAIDTSGSVDDEMISLIFKEIFSILAKRKHEITVIECDAKVQRVYTARTPDDVKSKILGRGGTLFAPVINYVNEHKVYRDALLIYFTDGYGEKEIPRPMTYRNIWAVIGDEKNLSLKEPYGIKITVKLS